MDRRSSVLLAVLGAGAFLVGLELMVTAVALPAILADLADWTELRRASWIVNGYLLAYIATMPLAGRAADRHGLPLLFSLSLLAFGVGSLLAGAAQSLDQLIAARVLQGAGGGGIVPLATAGASHLFSGSARARALGIVAATTFLGMAAGPFVGAAVLDTLDLAPALARGGSGSSPLVSVLAPSWRWIFYLGAPVALLGVLYLWAAAPGWPRERAGDRLDFLGAGLFTGGLAAAILALTSIGSTGDAGSITPVATVAAIILTAAALLRARRTAEPFLELRFFRDRNFSAAVLLSLLTGYALATAIIGGAVFVDRVRYGGPAEQQLALGALAGAMAVGAVASGLLLRRFGAVALSLVGIAVGVGGLVTLALSNPQTDPSVLAAGLGLFGLGFGLTVTPRSTVAVEALGRGAFGFASAAVTVARMIGMAVGLAVLTFLGSNRIEALSVVLTDAAARDRVLPPQLRGRSLQDGLVVDVLEAWAAQQAAGILAGLFAVAAAVMLVSLVPALAMRGAGGRRAAPEVSPTTPHAEQRREDRDDEAEPALAL
ncbi:MAG: MFS transporter [Candidatus Limnocylindrales bacterium]